MGQTLLTQSRLENAERLRKDKGRCPSAEILGTLLRCRGHCGWDTDSQQLERLGPSLEGSGPEGLLDPMITL